ncbi:YegP family protein [Arthrobacter sp. LjRoot14]|uniref:YegP family protein n=1 Tax=Arthrobacter sp. LjRoot14 TaxID=3342265 RepID=UPI003ED01050
MAGKFEVFVDAELQYRFRLTTPEGAELAVSGAYRDKPSAVAAIEAVRECAGMGLISDLCPAGSSVPAPAQAPAAATPAPVPAACDTRRFPVDGFRKHAAARRAPAVPHWSGAA